jgi:hypothetical protein
VHNYKLQLIKIIVCSVHLKLLYINKCVEVGVEVGVEGVVINHTIHHSLVNQYYSLILKTSL